MIDGRVSVHDDFSVVCCRLEKFFPDPSQVIGILLCEWNTGTNAGVNKQKITASKTVAQALQKQFVSARKLIEE